ncbi:putative exosome-associated protein [Geopyxis carbonaria]|nr:putative exosome-associated protein [Geopyxis carbonaria]
MDDGADSPQVLLEDLEDSLDDLTHNIKPLLQRSVYDTATRLTVADKARLYVLTTYTIESLLFSYLRLNGVNARDHPIRLELSRVRAYVQKIKNAQGIASPAEGAAGAGTGSGSNMTLDKGAAKRFIQAALAGNDKYDADRAEALTRERMNAHIKFDELSNRTEAVARDGPNAAASGEQPPTLDDAAPEATSASKKASKKRRSASVEDMDTDDAPAGVKRKKTKEKKKAKSQRNKSGGKS